MSAGRFSARSDAIAARPGGGWALHYRAAALAAAGADVILLSVGDHDLPCAPEVRAAARAALEDGPLGYVAVAGRPELRAAAAAHAGALAGARGWPAAEQVVAATGAQGALYGVLQAILDPGDAVLAADPYYVTYAETAAAAGARLETAPTRAEDGFRVRAAALEAALTPATRALLLNTPGNPTGAQISAADWREILDLAAARDLWVISDEVYADLTYEAAHASLLAQLAPGAAHADFTRWAVLGGVSKGFCMTGWRVGWSVTPVDLAERLAALGVCLHYGLPGLTQAGAVAALARADEITSALRARYRARRDLFCDALAGAPGLRVLRPPAGMFVMLDARAAGLGSEALAGRLLDEAGVALMPGASFGAAAEGTLRASLAAPPERLGEAAARIARLMRAL
ncbi:MAG: pyridoxal phosphate-dependent aminotransferase [Pseudomonadota bacterium]